MSVRANRSHQIAPAEPSSVRRGRTEPGTLRSPLGNQALQHLLLSHSVQAKLTVSQPGDPYEQEADRVADEVMRMPAPGLQRKCAACDSGGGTCAECAEEETVQRKEAAGPAPATDASPIPCGGGQALPAPERGFFESRFGRDFNGVRVHTGAEADASAKSFQALAYTHGSDIVFRSGQYSPQTPAGQRLLAHELTHVVQQRGVRSGVISPYRPKGSFNFGRADEPGLKEEEFKDKKKQPWIEKVTLFFDGSKIDSVGDLVATGTLKAKYHANPKALSDINIKIVGGSAKLGLTDKGKNFTVKRIEGVGYNDVIPPDPEGKGYPKNKYSKSLNASMHYAVFFKGKQAIHGGALDTGSHSCIHVDWTDLHTIRQINYHSVKGKTSVDVDYDPTALQPLCCERKKAVGYMVSNPCKGQDPKKCP